MSEQRLIIKAHQPHKRRRFMVAVAVSLLVVLGVWGVQLNLTFARYKVNRQEHNELQAAAESIQAATQLPPEASPAQASLTKLQLLIEQAVAQEEAKDQVLEKVTEDLQAQMVQPQAESAPVTPVVAGEETEIK